MDIALPLSVQSLIPYPLAHEVFSRIIWVVIPCGSVEVQRLLIADVLLSLLFDPEDGGNSFLRKFDGLLPNYTALRSRRWRSS
jgi:hypothetical protein